MALDISQPQRKKALLLHNAGTAVPDVFETLPCLQRDHQQEEEEEQQDEYTEAVNRLNTYFNPRKNVEYKVYVFRQARQQPGEILDQFRTRLRQLADTCEFQDINREITTQIVQDCTSSRLRRKALRDSKTTLAELLAHRRALEPSETQAQSMETTTNSPTLRVIA